MDKQIEAIKKEKEIADIISERDKVLRLLNENNEKALAEKARNCISFLDCLLDTKKIETIKEVKP